MFTSDLAESKQDKVSLYDVDPDAVEALIDYAYSNKVNNVFLIRIECICCGDMRSMTYKGQEKIK